MLLEAVSLLRHFGPGWVCIGSKLSYDVFNVIYGPLFLKSFEWCPKSLLVLLLLHATKYCWMLGLTAIFLVPCYGFCCFIVFKLYSYVFIALEDKTLFENPVYNTWNNIHIFYLFIRFLYTYIYILQGLKCFLIKTPTRIYLYTAASDTMNTSQHRLQ